MPQIDIRHERSPWFIPNLRAPMWCPCFAFAIAAQAERLFGPIVKHPLLFRNTFV